MATYIDGMKGGKHNSDNAIASFYQKKKTKVRKQLNKWLEEQPDVVKQTLKKYV